MKKIPFNKPEANSFSDHHLIELKKNNHFSSGGKFTKLCEKWLKLNLKCKEALLVHSCTAALEMTALLLDIKHGDEIIMPSYTFVSTANAFVLRGGKPVFIDIDSTTCNIDVTKIEKAINKKTKAIVVVHYAGVSCDMDPVLKIAKKYNIFVIEDAAQAIMSTYKGRPVGSIGDLATLSFHQTKNIHCGEGGALIINNKKFINKARIIRDKGTNRDLFNKNMIKKYTWVYYGSSYGLSEINAVFLYSQLIQVRKIIKKRLQIFNYYLKLFSKIDRKNIIKIPKVPNYSKPNGHMFYIIIQKNKRAKLMNYLKKKKISSVFHYIPLHSSIFGKIKTKTKFSMSNTNKISKNLLRLPLHTYMSVNDVLKIFKEIDFFFNRLNSKN